LRRYCLSRNVTERNNLKDFAFNFEELNIKFIKFYVKVNMTKKIQEKILKNNIAQSFFIQK